jgi:putative hemolysin
MDVIAQHFESAGLFLAQWLAFDTSRLLDVEIILRILLQVLLLLASAFFSSSETALFSLSRLDLRELRRSRNPKADTLLTLLDHPRKLIISILCGNEIINIAAAANMTAILVQLYSGQQVILLNILIMVPLLLLLGEVTPKTIAVTNPVAISTRVIATPMSLWVKIVAPFRWFIRLLAERVTTVLVGSEKAPENILHIDEFRSLLQEVEETGELRATERILIDNLLASGSTEVVEIMIPRTRVAFISADHDLPEIVSRVRQYKHRRIPVYKGDKDKLVGMIYAEDLMRMALEGDNFSLIQAEDIYHPVTMVPPTKKVDEMFDFFLEHKSQAAVVLNEFGGVEGLVTLKNVIDFIFGHTTGEDLLKDMFSETEPGVFIVEAEMKLNDFNAITNFGLVDTRMTTIGGVVLRHLDRLPSIDDEVTVDGIMLKVLELDGHRIVRVKAMSESQAQENKATDSQQDTEITPEAVNNENREEGS